MNPPCDCGYSRDEFLGLHAPEFVIEQELPRMGKESKLIVGESLRLGLQAQGWLTLQLAAPLASGRLQRKALELRLRTEHPESQ
jgi:hypothetical protein